MPGEKVIDRLPFFALSRPCEISLTDHRVLVNGYTGALGPHLSLMRGAMAAAFPLTEFDSFIIGTGKRPIVLLASLSFAVAGGVMFFFPIARYGGVVAIVLSLFCFMTWYAWPRSFFILSSRGVKISGQVNVKEAMVFFERLQLAARAARAGMTPEEIRASALLSGDAKAHDPTDKNQGGAPSDD